MMIQPVETRSRLSQSAGPRTVRLEPVRGDSRIDELFVPPGLQRIGSGDDCDEVLAIDGIAAHHCTIDNDGKRPTVIAASPLTWINDQPVRRTRLKSGDRLTLGPLTFLVTLVDSFPPAADIEPENFIETPMPRRQPAMAWDQDHIVPPTAPVTRRTSPPAPSPVRSPIGRVWSRVPAPGVFDRPEELLAEAQAAQALRDDLARIEEDIRKHQSRLNSLPLPEDFAITVPKEESKAQQRELDERSRELDERTHQLQQAQTLLQTERDELEAEQCRLSGMIETIEASRMEIEDQRQAVAEAVRQAREEREEWRLEREDQRRQLQELQQRVDQRVEQIRETEAELAEREQSLVQRIANCDERTAELDARAESLRTDSIELDQRQAELERSAAEIHQRQTALEEAAAQLEQTRDELAAERDRLMQDRGTLGQEVESLERDRAAHEAAVRELSAREERLGQQEEELQQQAQQLADQEAAKDEERSAALLSDSEPAELLALREQINEERRQMADEAKRLQSVRRQLDQDRSNLEEDRRQVLAERQESDAARQSAETQQHKIEELRRELARERQQLQESLEQLADERRALAEEERLIDDTRNLAVPMETREADSAVEAVSAPLMAEADLAADESVPSAGDVTGDEVDDADDVTPAEKPLSGSGLVMPASYLEFLEELHAGASRTEDAAPAAATAVAEVSPPVASAPVTAAPVKEPLPESADEQVTTEEPNAEGLRSTLAAMFGISQDQLNQAAERDDREQVRVPAVVVQEEQASPAHAAVMAPTSVPEAAETSADDSIAAYMQQLLARSNRSSGETAQPTTWIAETPRPAAPEPVVEPAGEAMPVAAPAAVAVETPPSPRKKPEPVDKEELRSHLKSMRQLANLSARSAVAQHHSRKLGMSFQVKLTLTILSALITVGLLTAELWGPNSYRVQGLGTLLITLFPAIELIRTVRTLNRVNTRAALSESECVGDDEAVDAPAMDSVP